MLLGVSGCLSTTYPLRGDVQSLLVMPRRPFAYLTTVIGIRTIIGSPGCLSTTYPVCEACHQTEATHQKEPRGRQLVQITDTPDPQVRQLTHCHLLRADPHLTQQEGYMRPKPESQPPVILNPKACIGIDKPIVEKESKTGGKK